MNALMEKSGLTVTLHERGQKPEQRWVAELVDAMRLVVRWQDERGLGASDLGPKHGLVGGDVEGAITYNGKFKSWEELSK